MLASERRNHTSFWRPYLDTLPARPSTGWFMKPQESADALKRQGVQAASALQACMLQFVCVVICFHRMFVVSCMIGLLDCKGVLAKGAKGT